MEEGARKLTNLTGFLQDARWSPDGRSIAVLFTENAVRAAGPLEPTTADVGVVEDKFFEQRLTLIDPASGRTRQLSPADTYVYEFDWSPDGKELVYTAAKGAGDNNWWVAQLFAIDAASGQTRLILKPAAQIAVPRWSADGKTIAFIGGIMSDEGSTGGDVYTVPAAMEEKRATSRLAAKLHRLGSPGRGAKLVITERENGGSCHLSFCSPGSGAARNALARRRIHSLGRWRSQHLARATTAEPPLWSAASWSLTRPKYGPVRIGEWKQHHAR